MSTAIDPLKVEVCDPFLVQTGSNRYNMEDLEHSSLEEKVDLGDLVLFPPDFYVNKEIDQGNFPIKDEPPENKINCDISDEADIKEEVIEQPVYAPIELSTHSNEKCQTCGLKFGNKAVLKIHNSIVHPEGRQIDQNYSAPSPNPSVDSTLRSLLNKQSELSKQGGIFLKNS